MRIGEVAEATGVSTKALRFYESEGLVAEPDRTESGYRDYQPDAIQRVGFIKRAQAAGLTLREIGEIIAVREDGRAPCAHVAELVDERLDEVDRRLEELRDVRAQLVKLRERVDRLDPRDCPPDEICAAIERR
jgi:DNA-binding transcriptional MerR regulator